MWLYNLDINSHCYTGSQNCTIFLIMGSYISQCEFISYNLTLYIKMGLYIFNIHLPYYLNEWILWGGKKASLSVYVN